MLRAIAAVPRDLFVPAEQHESAWDDEALPIAAGQTISQPTVVGRMCELLELTGEETVLDVGTGSGYHAAVLSKLAAHVYSIERHRGADGRRAGRARGGGDRERDAAVSGDGTRGYPEAAPYDAINVAARTEQPPPALVDQLAVGRSPGDPARHRGPAPDAPAPGPGRRWSASSSRRSASSR